MIKSALGGYLDNKMNSSWNLRIEELQTCADIAVRFEIENILKKSPGKNKFVEGLREKIPHLTRGLGFIEDKEEKQILEFYNYLAGASPCDALFISVVHIGAASGGIKRAIVFLPAQSRDVLELKFRQEKIRTTLFPDFTN